MSECVVYPPGGRAWQQVLEKNQILQNFSRIQSQTPTARNLWLLAYHHLPRPTEE